LSGKLSSPRVGLDKTPGKGTSSRREELSPDPQRVPLHGGNRGQGWQTKDEAEAGAPSQGPGNVEPAGGRPQKKKKEFSKNQLTDICGVAQRGACRI